MVNQILIKHDEKRYSVSQPIYMCSTIQAKTFCYHDNILGSRPLQYKGLLGPPLTFHFGAVASWLVRLTPESAVQVRVL